MADNPGTALMLLAALETIAGFASNPLNRDLTMSEAVHAMTEIARAAVHAAKKEAA